MALRTDNGPNLVDFAGDNLDGLGRANSRNMAGGSSPLATDLYSVHLLMYNGPASALVAGDALALDLATSGFVAGKWVRKSAATDDTAAGFAIAFEAAAASSSAGHPRLEVIIKGYCARAAVASGTAAGDLLQFSDTAGTLEKTATPTERAFAVALTDVSSGFSAIWIY